MIWIERQKTSMKGRLRLTYEVRQNERNKREATIWTAHTVTVNSLDETLTHSLILLRVGRYIMGVGT